MNISTGGNKMVKDGVAPKEKRNGYGKRPDEQRRGKAKSNSKGTAR